MPGSGITFSRFLKAVWFSCGSLSEGQWKEGQVNQEATVTYQLSHGLNQSGKAAVDVVMAVRLPLSRASLAKIWAPSPLTYYVARQLLKFKYMPRRVNGSHTKPFLPPKLILVTLWHISVP